MSRIEPRLDRYVTKGGIAVDRHTAPLPAGDVAEPLVKATVGEVALRDRTGKKSGRVQRTDLSGADLQNARTDGVNLAGCLV